MENYKFFNDPYKFSGKHARMVSELWSLNDYEHSYFKRLIDIYIVAAFLGFRIDRKAKRDSMEVRHRIYNDSSSTRNLLSGTSCSASFCCNE